VLNTGLSSMKLRKSKGCGCGYYRLSSESIQGLQRELLIEILFNSSSAVRNSDRVLSDCSEFDLSAIRQISLGLIKL
jgi:hypothetical protein